VVGTERDVDVSGSWLKPGRGPVHASIIADADDWLWFEERSRSIDSAPRTTVRLFAQWKMNASPVTTVPSKVPPVMLRPGG
jgi:hypothetical protein